MVRAILDGSKTQTRRIVRVDSAIHLDPLREHAIAQGSAWFTDDPEFPGNHCVPCPYGAVGDRLWVREAIRAWTFIDDDGPCVEYVADGHIHDDATWVWKVDYLPSMFMPKGLSRITLEITDVRVQRLQEISEDDAVAEGVAEYARVALGEPDALTAYGQYAFLWDSINAERAPWDSNPWVWAITFERAA
jgi:hypothetical protein